MTKESWKRKRRVPYLGYEMLGHSWLWIAVDRIGPVKLNTRTLTPNFDVFFNSGKVLNVKYDNLTCEPIRIPGLFGSRDSKDAQAYFNRDCKVMKQIHKIQENAVKAFFNYHRSILKSEK